MTTILQLKGDLTPEQLKSILESALPDTPVTIGGAEDNVIGGIDITVGTLGEVGNGSEENVEELKRKLSQTEATSKKALASIQTFHKQQKALFDEFVLLRQRYDDLKVSLLDVLWLHCSIHHPDLRQIPDMEDASTFVENDEQVGRYTVGEVLGEGQFATVKICYLGNSEGHEMALKIINKDQISSFVALRRVSNEIGILKKLQGPWIVRVTDVFQTKQHLYIVTEKGGLDLFAFFDEYPDGVPESWAREIIANTFQAVFFCHSRGVCHRDLKPENILLEFDPNTEKCIDLKLCDFGLSTSYQTSSANVLLNDFCGSPGFFAPEMITNGSYYGDHVDIWSVGCILLELILGHQKFCDLWMTAYDYEIMQDKERFSKEIETSIGNLQVNLDFSDPMKSFVLRVLTIDTENRASAREISLHPWFEGALESAVYDEKVTGPVPVLMAQSGQLQDPQIVDTTAGLSNRERRLIQQYAANGEGVSLPPIEPATPSLRGARKILKSGEKLASQAAAGNWDTHSSPAGTGMRQDSFDSPVGSPNPQSVLESSPLLPGSGGDSLSPHVKIMPGGRFGRAVSIDVSISESIEEDLT